MASQLEWVIETHNLTKIYGDGEQIYALDTVNLKIAPGELVSVMGPSGSGKSTLLNILGALDLPTQGEVVIAGKGLTVIHDIDQFRAKTVGFVFQLHNLLPTLTAIENVEVPMIGHENPHDRQKRAKELLEIVGLADRINHLPSQLSGGQRQRVAVARALANKPLIVFADEPTGNLDSAASRDLMALIRDINKNQGTTFVVVTHDPAIARQTRRVLVMADGKIAREDFIGSPLEEDLKMWRHSGLGRRIVNNEEIDLQNVELTDEHRLVIHDFLQQANSGD